MAAITVEVGAAGFESCAGGGEMTVFEKGLLECDEGDVEGEGMGEFSCTVPWELREEGEDLRECGADEVETEVVVVEWGEVCARTCTGVEGSRAVVAAAVAAAATGVVVGCAELRGKAAAAVGVEEVEEEGVETGGGFVTGIEAVTAVGVWGLTAAAVGVAPALGLVVGGATVLGPTAGGARSLPSLPNEPVVLRGANVPVR